MEPAFAAFFAVALGGEVLTTRLLAGGALVLTARYVAELGPRRARRRGDAPRALTGATPR